jgi:hypothetical protein
VLDWIKGKALLILAGVVAVLLIALVAVGSYSRLQATKITGLNEDLTRVTGQLTEANQKLVDAAASAKVTDEVVADNTQEKSIADTKTAINIAKVDALVTKRTYNEINDAQLESALSDSMWDAYCAAVPASDPDCTARKPATGLQGGQATSGGKVLAP